MKPTMDLVQVRIHAGDIALGENQLMYPARYNAIEVDRKGLGTGGLNKVNVSMSGDIGRGADFEYMVIAMPKPLSEEYALDPDMMIIDSVTADDYMEINRLRNGVPIESVQDPNRLQAITAKQSAGIALSQEDLEALDPEKPVRGINKSRKLAGETIAVNDDLSTLTPEMKQLEEPKVQAVAKPK